jgi:competence protein ComEC
MLTIALSSAWLLGICLGYYCQPGHMFALCGLLPLSLLFVFRRTTNRLLTSGLICVFVFICSASFTSPAASPQGASLLRSYNDSGLIQIKGMVGRDVEFGPNSSRLYINVSAILQGDYWIEISGTTLLLTDRYPEHRYGETVTVSGILKNPSSGQDQYYTAFLARQGIYSVMEYPEISITGYHGSPFLQWLYATRHALNRSLSRLLPEPQASLAQGIALGVRSNIPVDIKQDFSLTGTTHLLAISGVNLTIIAGILSSLVLRFFGRRYYIHIWLTAFIILLYSWLTGLQPPVLRAALMVGFFLTADLFGRQKSGIITLFLAAVVMTLINPGILFDASSQLSFLSMTGLIIVTPLLQQAGRGLVERITAEGKIQETINTAVDSFCVSVGAMITTWPLIAYYFNIFSWIGPLATFLTLPLMPAIIVSAALAGGIGLFVLPLAQAAAWIAWLPLSYLLMVVTVLGHLPGIALGVTNLTPFIILLYYILLIVFLLSIRYLHLISSHAGRLISFLSRITLKRAVIPLVVIVILTWSFGFTMPDQNIHVTFFDVGQGDAILIAKGTRQILVDGGPGTQAVSLALSRKMPFWDRTIDMVVLTHPDSDHLTGLVEILKRYRVKSILADESAKILADSSALYQAWLAIVQEKHLSPIPASIGQVINIGDEMAISVLNPNSDIPGGEKIITNDRSIVLQLRAGEVSFLLTGDLSTTVETELVRTQPSLHSTVLKVGHHGSAASSSEAFLNAVSPEIAVISVGRENAYGHPNMQVVQRLQQRINGNRIFRTDRDGTIEFITNGHRIWVKTEN